MQEHELRALLSRMSLEEKAGQLTQIPLSVCAGGLADPTGPMMQHHLTPEDTALCGSLICDQDPDAAAYARIVEEMTAAHPHRIPPVLMRDVIHGCRTVFPIPLALGCTFDEGLAKKMGRVSAVEAAASGYHATFAPMADVVRDPRWGRVMESVGESSALCGAMSAAMVRGFHGEGADTAEGIAACAKHFAAYGLCQAGQDYAPVDVGRAEMYNVYLPPFKAALDAGCDMVMPAFVMIDRIPCVCNKWLLTDILRDRWHSDAMVISDYADVAQLFNHGMVESLAEASELALSAGTDMDMMSFAYLKGVPELVRAGKLPIEAVDAACLRVLRLKNKLGLFERPVKNADPAVQAAAYAVPAHKEAALNAALRSCVLLKNEGVLPLKPGTKVALVGNHADNRGLLGAWSLDGKTEETETLLEAFRRDSRIQLVPVEEAEVILYAAGEDQGEVGEGCGKAFPQLTHAQMDELRRLRALGKPLAMLLVCGKPLILTDVLPQCDALLNIWFPGTMGAEAVRRLVIGDANPSGHLSMTFPRSIGQIPIHHDKLSTARPYCGGAPFTKRYVDEEITPLFPFGYGLSYTTFALADPCVSDSTLTADAPVTARVTVTNTGSVPGETVVQLYVRMKHLHFVRAEKSLIAWQRVSLAPGETKAVELPVTLDMLRLYDHAGQPVPLSGPCMLMFGLDSGSLTAVTEVDVRES